MARRFHDIDEMIRDLQARHAQEVSLTGKVATTTSPGGGEITFRGRLIVSADLGGGDRAEYIHQVSPYVTQHDAPAVPATKSRAEELKRCQLALMHQLRAYRGEYQGLMDAARTSLTERFTAAGINVVEPEG